MTDTTRRLTPKRILEDLEAFKGLAAVSNYHPPRSEATPDALQEAYAAMVQSQERETEMVARLKATRDQARKAEWAFHNAVLAMKQAVLGQFGPDSNEIQAIGYKKKSKRKPPQRRAGDGKKAEG